MRRGLSNEVAQAFGEPGDRWYWYPVAGGTVGVYVSDWEGDFCGGGPSRFPREVDS